MIKASKRKSSFQKQCGVVCHAGCVEEGRCGLVAVISHCVTW